MSKVVPISPPEKAPARMLVTLTDEDLRNLIVEELAKVQPKPEKLLYTAGEAAEMLSLEKSWILEGVRVGEIECQHKGHYVRFTKAQIQKIAEMSTPPRKKERRN
jgi:hypothetical protein